MKKITIISPLEYGSLVLEALGMAGTIQLKEVSGNEFIRLKESSTKIDYSSLYQKWHNRYTELADLMDEPIIRSRPELNAIKTFSSNPLEHIQTLQSTLDEIIAQFKIKKDEEDRISKELLEELKNSIDKYNVEYDKKKKEITDEMAIGYLQALSPEEYKRSFKVWIVKNEEIPNIEPYLNRYKENIYKKVPISEDESFLFIFGSEESRKWVEALYLLFDIKDVFDVLDSRDVLLVLNSDRRKEVIEKYKTELNKLEESLKLEGKDSAENILQYKLREIEEAKREEMEKIKLDYNEKLKKVDAIKKEREKILGEMAYYDYLLRIYATHGDNVLRSKVTGIIQGWTLEKDLDSLQDALSKVEEQIGEVLFVEIQDVNPEEDIAAPATPMGFGTKLLQPLWILTSLRGWPSAGEINPGVISVLFFSFQFGLMFGDIGQGLIFLIAGFYLANKYDRGMMQKIGGLFIPMGISATIFGVLYDSIFLMEGLLFHHHQVLPNPIQDTTKLLLLVFQIAAIEVIIGVIIGSINQIRKGNPIGALGEHGLGMILYVTGLYLSVLYFIEVGMDFIAVFSHWTFYLMLVGMGFSFIEPIIHSIATGHGFKIEAVGEGVGGLLMTFVEGLANLFSFLRVAAFAIAHASLAIAAEALTRSMGIPGIGLVIMNVVALSFEFMSSSVQSLRLLYYEFMGKFYSGEGVPFNPFRIPRSSTNPIKTKD